MKRVTQPPRRRKKKKRYAPMITIIAAMVCITITIVLICVFTIKPNSQETVSTPETITSESILNQSESSDAVPPSDVSSNISSSGTVTINTSHFIPKSAEVDDTYFSNTLFIGNSITEGFKEFSGLDTPTYYEGRGMTVESIHRMKVVNADNSPNADGTGTKTVMDALKDRQFDQIYLLMGANELGWIYPDMFIEQYSQLIDDIKALQPNAKICVQSILPVSAERSETDDVYNNTKIENLNNMIINMTAEKGIPYLNAAEVFKDDTGALPADKTPDGIHLTAAACKEWRMYIKTHVMK
ncbi:MAG: GDSL-type esterase/lipase family protein [Acutalibacteraceae bacterium]|nr:GDSL-type esterase/lipase family protein [Acutalibacteraceae bacterium]